MHLSRFPRISFAHLPTPLEPLKNLSKQLGGPNIWIKRDDCTGLAGGGNKTRKLEFLLADAINKGADTIITQGATQSNHCRQTAAIATKLNLKCFLLFEDRINSDEEQYNQNGNVLLDYLLGSKYEKFPADTDMNAEMEKLADKLKADGHKPYIIPGGGSNEIGALGYVNCALEMLYQATTMNLKMDRIVTATGSAGTQAGLIAGLELSNSQIPLLGIGVRAPKPKQEENVFNLALKTADFLGVKNAIQREKVVANCDYVGKGYGIPAEDTIEAIKIFAKSESILLDPVYSGKGAAGFIDLIKKGEFEKDENVVFLHTGGAQALFAYKDMLMS